MPSAVLCVYDNQKREQEGKAVVINEDILHAADVNGNGDAKVAQRRPVTRREPSVSVFPLGSTTTDTAGCATNAANAADAGTSGLFGVRNRFD